MHSRQLKTETLDIWKAVAEHTFDQTELSVTDSLFKGMSKFLLNLKQALLKESLDENLKQERECDGCAESSYGEHLWICPSRPRGRQGPPEQAEAWSLLGKFRNSSVTQPAS